MYAQKIARKETNYMKNQGWGDQLADIYFKRLVDHLYNFKPTFLHSQYAQPLPRKPKVIFLNSMSEPAFWKKEWYDMIIKKVTENFQHTFLVLTKDPEVYTRFSFPHNVWLGVTVENQYQLNEFECVLSNRLDLDKLNNKMWLSIEPIRGKIKITGYMRRCIDWIVVGPQTGTPKITADPEWIRYFYHSEIPVFMKSACSKIINTLLRQDRPLSLLPPGIPEVVNER
jgi:protein gp37